MKLREQHCLPGSSVQLFHRLLGGEVSRIFELNNLRILQGNVSGPFVEKPKLSRAVVTVVLQQNNYRLFLFSLLSSLDGFLDSQSGWSCIISDLQKSRNMGLIYFHPLF